MSALTIDHVLVPVRVPRRPARDAVVIPFPTPATRRADRDAHVHITRRGRLTLTLTIVLAVSVAATALLVSASAPAALHTAPVPTAELVVTPGDTLWEIAASVAAPGEDVRDVIADIRELNDLQSSGLVVGQELVVPVAA